MIEIKEEYELLNNYLYLFEQQSINNTTAGIISFFVIMGQCFKNQFTIPIGAINIDIRVSCFWLQDARSGKSISWDFIYDVADKCGLVCESPDEWSDAGLIGTIEMDKSGDVTPIPGILENCDILQIDEASALFAKKSYNQSTILYLQKTLNYLGSKTSIITKQLKAGMVECKPHCSLWLTSFPPREVIDEVLDKGFFQRVIFYPNKVSMGEKKAVSNIRLGGLWSAFTDEEINIKSISNHIMNLKVYYKSKGDDVLPPNDIRKAISMVRNKIRGLYKHIEPMENNNEKIMGSFMSNFENNIAVFSTILAISRKSHYIEEIDINQSYAILYEIFENISSWIETERTDDFKADRDLVRIVAELKDTEGWIRKSKLIKQIVEDCKVVKKTAYNRVEKIETLSKKGGFIRVSI